MSKSYPDSCAGAHALDIVGDRWALLVVRELMLGPRRYTDLSESLVGISPNVLSQRLADLAEKGVIAKRTLPAPYGATVYQLTEWGKGLEPVLCELGRWGARSPELPRDNPLSVSSIVLSYRTMFDAAAAAGVSVELELHIPERPFRVSIEDGVLSIEPGEHPDPEAVISGESEILAAATYGGAELPDLIAAGDIRIEGDRSAAERFFACFSLPAPATIGG